MWYSPETFNCPPRNQLIFPLERSQSVTWSKGLVHASLSLAMDPQKVSESLIDSSYKSAYVLPARCELRSGWAALMLLDRDLAWPREMNTLRKHFLFIKITFPLVKGFSKLMLTRPVIIPPSQCWSEVCSSFYSPWLFLTREGGGNLLTKRSPEEKLTSTNRPLNQLHCDPNHVMNHKSFGCHSRFQRCNFLYWSGVLDVTKYRIVLSAHFNDFKMRRVNIFCVHILCENIVLKHMLHIISHGKVINL